MLKKIKILVLVVSVFSTSISIAQSQPYDELRWKSMQNVTAILGEPISKKGPVGTVREYQIWTYANCVVAFTNNRVTHAFDWPVRSKLL